MVALDRQRLSPAAAEFRVPGELLQTDPVVLHAGRAASARRVALAAAVALALARRRLRARPARRHWPRPVRRRAPASGSPCSRPAPPAAYRPLVNAHVAVAAAGAAVLLISLIASGVASGFPGRRSLGEAGSRTTIRTAVAMTLVGVAALIVAGNASARALARRAPHRQPDGGPAPDGGGRRRPVEPVLPFVGQHQRQRHHPGELLHDQRRPAGAATRTSTTSGTRRRTTSRRSTTSGTASRSSTCRTWSARSRRSGARAATTMRCSSTAASTGRSRSRSTRRKRRPAWPARRATRSSHVQQLDGAGRLRRSSTRRCTTWPRARTRCSAGRTTQLVYLAPRAAPRHLHEAVPPRADRRVLLVVPQGAPRRAGERLPLVPRLQRLRQLAGLGRVGPGRALVLLPAAAAEVRRLPHAARRLERSGGEERQGASRTAFPAANTALPFVNRDRCS